MRTGRGRAKMGHHAFWRSQRRRGTLVLGASLMRYGHETTTQISRARASRVAFPLALAAFLLALAASLGAVGGALAQEAGPAPSATTSPSPPSGGHSRVPLDLVI